MARIAILTAEFTPFLGGIATYASSLATAAERLGHKVTVFAPDYGNDLAAADVRNFVFRVERFRAGPFSPRWYPRYAQVALHAVLRNRSEQVLAADIPFIELLAATKSLHRYPYAAAIHGSEVNRSRYSTRSMLFATAGIFTSPSHIFANSCFTRERLLMNYPQVDAKRVSVAYLGVAKDWFEPGDTNRLPAGVRPDQGRHLVVSVGRLTPRKGQLTLVRAISGLTPPERAQLTLVMVGSEMQRDRSYKEELLRAAEKVKPADFVVTGSLEDVEVKALYSVSDLFCLPGSSETNAVEGFGLVFLEAAAQGLTAIAGAVGGVPEVVRDGETGVLVPPDNPKALGIALVDLLKDRERRERFGAAARAQARSFTWERCALETFGEA